MTLLLSDSVISSSKFKELFPLEVGGVVIAGGKRAGQTAGMARYSVTANKRGRQHVLELGYGTVPARNKKPKDYPLLLPKLDSQLGRFNIDGNTNNVLILKFLENEDKKLVMQSFRNFNAPCEIETSLKHDNEKLALAMIEIASLRVHDIAANKIDVDQDPQLFIKLIHHAIEMRAGHVLKASIA